MNRSDGKKISRRRALLYGAGAVVGAGLGGAALYHAKRNRYEATTFVGRAKSYADGGKLADLIQRGLAELGVSRAQVHGKAVLLKPNLVEPFSDAPHINTHPVLIRAAAEAFSRLDAREVAIAEGPGHVRDTHLVLEQSGMAQILDRNKLTFFDLNHDDVTPVLNKQRFTRLKQIFLPRTLKRFDLLVSLPKLKTHHWAGVTLSLKNLFGLMPGIVYGWPKNILHHHGISRSILDIYAAVRPQLAIVDGIVGMEGDGPIMGTPRQAGVVVLGESLPAVDATATRLMGLDPYRIDYLAVASDHFGPIRAQQIEQRGEPLHAPRTPFRLVDHPVVDWLRKPK